ncbi:MAG: hypothetical protein R3F34_09650 [Planctomycetota bacterium]
MIWLGRERGNAYDWVTQLWVRATGRRVDLREQTWLDGPIGGTEKIGEACFRELAVCERLEVVEEGGVRGLVPGLEVLDGPNFDASRVAPEVRRFYERTSEYELDAWSQWCAAYRPFGGLLARLFSRRLQQMNVPLSGLDTSHGMTSRVVHLVEPASREVRHVVWARTLRRTGATVYSGSYGACRIPGHDGPCLRVVFPLPNGNAVVVMRPQVGEDGALTLVSSGKRFGDPGFYFTVRRPNGRAVARRVRTMRETIRVARDDDGESRADHEFRLLGSVFLRLHYRMRTTAVRHDASESTTDRVRPGDVRAAPTAAVVEPGGAS